MPPSYQTTIIARTDEGAHVATNVTTAPVTLLAANTRRNSVSVQNQGVVGVYLGLGQTAVVGEGILLAAGSYWEPFVCPVDAISAIAAAGTQLVVAIEGTVI